MMCAGDGRTGQSECLRLFMVLHFRSLCGYLLLWKVEVSDSTVILSSPVFPLRVGRVSTMLYLGFTNSVFYIKLC